MKTSITLGALFALAVSAQNDNNGVPSSGPNKAGYANTPEGLKILELAGDYSVHRSINPFMRNYNNTPEHWQWMVTVADVPVPNRISDLGKEGADFSEGLHVANTQWDFDWPRKAEDVRERIDRFDTLQKLLADRNASVSFTALIYHSPREVTNKYNRSDNGNCRYVLGEQCTQSLTEAATKDSGQIKLSGLEGCEGAVDILGSSIAAGGFGMGT
jgi:hypothetical protein